RRVRREELTSRAGTSGAYTAAASDGGRGFHVSPRQLSCCAASVLRRSGFLRAPAGQGGLAIVLALAGCSAWPDPTSVSQGDSNRGAVLRPRRIAAAGPGWELPPTWRERGLHYGTDAF